MNRSLARVAQERAEKGLGPREAGRCQQWVRLCVQALYGDDWDRWLWKPSARLAAEAFAAGHAAGDLPDGAEVIASPYDRDTALGDLLYNRRGSGGHGHVGIRVEGNRVAENSSTSVGRLHGAIGFRPLASVAFDTIVRLPDPEAAKQLAAWYAETAHSPLGALYAAAGVCPDQGLGQRVTARLNALNGELVAAGVKA